MRHLSRIRHLSLVLTSTTLLASALSCGTGADEGTPVDSGQGPSESLGEMSAPLTAAEITACYAALCEDDQPCTTETGASTSVWPPPSSYSCTRASNTGLRCSQSPAMWCGSTGLCTQTFSSTYTPTPSPLDVFIDRTVPTSVHQLSRYLAACEIQTPSTVTSLTAQTGIVMMRGKVKNRAGAVEPDVTVKVLEEVYAGGTPTIYGTVKTLLAGQFSMRAVGGKAITLVFEKSGFLPVQRRVTLPDEGYITVPEVRLTPQTSVASTLTTLTTGTASWQKLTGPTTTDTRGSRTPRIVVPVGTVVKSSGTALSGNLTMRMTEFTSSADGPQAMPATLPGATAYTYAADFTFDGQSNITFTNSASTPQPVYVYLESPVAGIPAGSTIPSGYLDTVSGTWKASDNGVAVVVDASGNWSTGSVPNTISATEKATAALPVSKTYWRIPITHFSAWDFNFAYKIACGSGGCKLPPFLGDSPFADGSGCAMTEQGSIITCANQTLGEVLPVMGTPHSLVYASDRVPGRTSDREVVVRLRDGTLPAEIQNVHLEVTVAGQNIIRSWSAGAAPLTQPVQWNGMDSLGRVVQGKQQATVRVGYEYKTDYAVSIGDVVASFGKLGTELAGVQVIPGNGTPTYILWREWKTTLGNIDVKPLGFGGWTLSNHHVLDPRTNIFYGGGGTSVDATLLGATIKGLSSFSGPSLRATAGLAPQPDGSVIAVVGLTSPSSLRRISPTGAVTTWPSVALPISEVVRIAPGQDGSVLVVGRSSTCDWKIYRVTSSGSTAVAGQLASAVCTSSGAGPASTATFTSIDAIAEGPDGQIYVLDDNRLRRINTLGEISTVLQRSSGLPILPNNIGSPPTPVLPSTSVQLAGIYETLAVDKLGQVYMASGDGRSVYRLEVDGNVRHFGGGTNTSDGAQVLPTSGCTTVSCLASMSMQYPRLAIDREGNLLIAGPRTVRVIDAQNQIQPVAGRSDNVNQGSSGNGGLAINANLGLVGGMAVGADGSILIAEVNGSSVRSIKPLAAGVITGGFAVPSADGSEVYLFNPSGRHESTVDGLTGVTRFAFAYNASNQLSQVTDEMGRVMTIDRTSEANKVKLLGPDASLSTVISLDANGWVDSVTYPESLVADMTHQSDGLLTSFKDLKGNEHTFQYTSGRLTQDLQPASVGGTKTLTRTSGSGYWQVDVTTASGRTTKYRTDVDQNNRISRTSTRWDGLATKTIAGADGSTTTTFPASSPLVTTVTTPAPDVRYGMAAPVGGKTAVTIGATTLTTNTRSFLNPPTPPPANPLLPGAWCEITSINAPTPGDELTSCTAAMNAFNWKTSYSGPTSARQITVTTPVMLSSSASRSASVTLDAKGRLATLAMPEVAAVTYTYSPTTGRLATVTQGSRTLTLGYNDSTTGYLSSIQTPATQSTTLTVDGAGRATLAAFGPTGSTVSSRLQLTPDANGNLASLTLLDQPGQSGQANPIHSFGYSAIDQVITSTAPAVSPVINLSSTAAYTQDGLLDLVTTPSGGTIDPSYDTKGRLSTLAYSGDGGRTITAGYTDSTGQLTSLTTPSSGPSLAFSYNGPLLSQVTSSNPGSHYVHWDHDSQFRPTTEEVDGTAVTYALDRDNTLLSVTYGAGPALSFGRSAASGRKTSSSVTVGGGTVTEGFQYDATYGEWTRYEALRGTTTLYAVDYKSRDALGRLTLRDENIGGTLSRTQYGYDTAGRLTSVQPCSNPGASLTCTVTGTRDVYEYDSNGNRTAWKTYDTSGTLLTTLNYTYDAQDRLVSSNQAGSSTPTTYKYNPEGGRSQRRFGTLSIVNSFYSLMGELLSYSPALGTPTTYTYDPLGRRVTRTRASVTTSWVYLDSLRPALQIEPSRTLRFVYGTRGNVPELIVDQTSNIVYRLIVDERGSVRRVVQIDTGAVVQELTYDAWGKVLTDSSPGFQPFGYAGGLYDSATGLVRFGVRDYDPNIGRWTAKEPLGLGGGDANLYAYAGNDPINHVDPDGRYWVIVGGAILGGAFDLSVQLYGNGNKWGCVDWSEVLKWSAGGAALGLLGEYAVGTAFSGTSTTGSLVAVTQWGGRASPWVMAGGNNLRNWLFSGVAQYYVGDLLKGRASTYTYGSGVTSYVEKSALSFPSGWEWFKGFLGQRIISQLELIMDPRVIARWSIAAIMAAIALLFTALNVVWAVQSKRVQAEGHRGPSTVPVVASLFGVMAVLVSPLEHRLLLAVAAVLVDFGTWHQLGLVPGMRTRREDR